jgi:hypothetical protein
LDRLSVKKFSTSLQLLFLNFLTTSFAARRMSLLVILGINGRQGRSVANAFLNEPGWRIRGLTRSPFCIASEDWRAVGVEIVGVNPSDVDDLRTAFKDATAIFIRTDYYSYVVDHSVHTLAYMTSKPLDDIASSQEIVYGREVLDAVAGVPELQRLIWSTVRTANAPTRLGRAQIENQAALKEYLGTCFPHLLGRTSFLYPCLRMEDYATMLDRVSKHAWSKKRLLTYGCRAKTDFCISKRRLQVLIVCLGSTSQRTSECLLGLSSWRYHLNNMWLQFQDGSLAWRFAN